MSVCVEGEHTPTPQHTHTHVLARALSPSPYSPFIPLIPLIALTSVCCGMTAEYLEKGHWWILEFISARVAVLLTFVSVVVTAAVGALTLAAARLFAEKAHKAALHPFVLSVLLAEQCFLTNEITTGSIFVKEFIPFNFMGLFLYSAVFVVGCVVLRHHKVFFCGVLSFFTVYGILQHYVSEFREMPIRAADIFNIASAIGIASDYKPTFSFEVIYALAQLVAMCWLVWKTSLKPVQARQRLVAVVVLLLCTMAFVGSSHLIYSIGLKTGVIAGKVFKLQPWCVGSLLFFYYDATYNRLRVPRGYSVEKAKRILGARLKEQAASGENKLDTGKKKPDIICIMNESFADYAHIAPFNVTLDYMPNYRALVENAIKGNVTVSAYGGYSANSEYEFLTGCSMHFLPVGSVPFTYYLKHRQESMVTLLRSYGYKTVALAGCSRDLWNIGDAYGFLEFETRYFEHNISLPDRPRVNGRASDEAMFQKVREVYETRDKSRGLFVWTTTMQNHGPYTVDTHAGVRLRDVADVAAERYLNSVRKSDEAFGSLVEYFKRQSDPVVLLMFGDHFPHILSFASHLFGKELGSLSLQERNKMQQTPFVIWSNRPMKSEEVNEISLNYLSSKLMEVAGLPKSAMQLELDRVRKSVPVINSFGFKGDNGNWYFPQQRADSKYASILNEYYTAQYYKMFDQWKESKQ